MKIRKIIALSIALVLLSGLFGCAGRSSQKDINQQTNSNQPQNSKTDQTDKVPSNSDSQSKDNADKGNSASQDNSSNPGDNAGQSSNSKPTSNIPPQTQQEAIAKVSAVVKTKVPLMLPTNVPTDKGKYLTAATASQQWHYKVDFYQVNQPADIDSETASKGKLMATVEGTEYKDAASAQDEIKDYTQVDTSKYPEVEINLGHNIKALGDTGLGHGYIIWNEGRWCIRIDSPNDPAYKNKEYPDSKKLAESIVEYLNSYMLPAPQKIGVIDINNWNNSQGTTLKWQYNEMVYQVWSQDPMTALKVAVAMKFK